MSDVQPGSRRTKQVIAVRRDLGMRRGKEVAQGAHASMAWLGERVRKGKSHADGGQTHGWARPAGDDYHVETLIELSRAEYEWLMGPFAKIVCQVPDEAALREVHERATAAGLASHLITDAGLTEFGGVPTPTAVAVGPDWEDLVDSVTRELKLY